MKLFLILTTMASISAAQITQFGGLGSAPPPQFGDRPNFICQTSPNAARMYLKAYVHTYFHSKTVKVELTHISTYREEVIATHTSRPTVMKPNELRLDRPSKSENSNDIFPAFNFAPAITYQLVHRSGRNWNGQFSVIVQNSNTGKSQVRKYKMNCEKM